MQIHCSSIWLIDPKHFCIIPFSTLNFRNFYSVLSLASLYIITYRKQFFFYSLILLSSFTYVVNSPLSDLVDWIWSKHSLINGLFESIFSFVQYQEEISWKGGVTLNHAFGNNSHATIWKWYHLAQRSYLSSLLGLEQVELLDIVRLLWLTAVQQVLVLLINGLQLTGERGVGPCPPLLADGLDVILLAAVLWLGAQA